MERQSALRIAFATGLAAACATGAFLHLLPGSGLAASTLAGAMAISFGASFGMAYGLVGRYVKQRLDVLHRAVHEARTGKPGEEKSIGRAAGEVAAWADEKRTEIGELRKREQYRREFIGNLAHELRTPIFSIQGYILTLLEGGLEDPKVNRDFLVRANNGVERLIRTVEDLGMITEVESGVLRMQPGPVDLNGLLDTIIHELRKKAAARGARIVNALEGEVMVEADAGRMAQVFNNLLVNAVNYGKPGGEVQVHAYDAGDRVLVEVSDNGPGIAGEHLPRLFERFYRVGSSRARDSGGSGLGLAIVKHIVESHGGTIQVRSKVGEGATFSFTLPKAA